MSRIAGLSDLEHALLAFIGHRSGSGAILAARTALLARRDAVYDDALTMADHAVRAAAVARAAGIEEAVKVIEAMLSP